MLSQTLKELLVVGEQPYELRGPEPDLGPAAVGSQQLFDQGEISQTLKELLKFLPPPDPVQVPCSAPPRLLQPAVQHHHDG